MKAYILEKNGGIENLVLSSVPAPVIKEKELLVKVKSIAINRVDPFVRQSAEALKLFVNLPLSGPIILGWDISGVVEETGSSVTKFKNGDEVFGLVNFFGHGQGYAEYVAAPEDHLALKPENISHHEAAASGLAALTAWQALVTFGKIKRGGKVLIHGASGGVGHFAIQIAKSYDAEVVGVGSSGNRPFILSLGADRFIDYGTEAFEEIVQDADLVLDSLPGSHVIRSARAARPGGRVISLLPFADENGVLAEIVHSKGLYMHRLVVRSNGDDMSSIASLLERKLVKPYVSRVFDFEALPMSHLQLESGKTKGKVVVQVSP